MADSRRIGQNREDGSALCSQQQSTQWLSSVLRTPFCRQMYVVKTILCTSCSECKRSCAADKTYGSGPY